MLALSLSFDHRMIDGATAQNALNQIKRLLNDPELIINGGVITMVVGDFPIEIRYTCCWCRPWWICCGNSCSTIRSKSNDC